ncbi:MAG TPA: hypothetical protein VEJ84_08135 [Acidimicrobiales bacterium]|nr:hypothetical protein [Acidimicrobiales bacterium]
MSRPSPIYLEIGSRRLFACSLEWPGLARSSKDEDGALAALSDYVPRYAAVAGRAQVKFPLAQGYEWSVVQRVPTHSGGADFGTPTTVLEEDGAGWGTAEAKRIAALLAASWDGLDEVVAAAPEALRKGPRGGGRDRDAIVAHVAGAEQMYGRKMGLSLPVPAPGDRQVVLANRAAILEWHRTGGQSASRPSAWPPRYAARRLIWHVLDHLWEIEDRSD